MRIMMLCAVVLLSAVASGLAAVPPLRIEGYERVGVGITRGDQTIFAQCPTEWRIAKGDRTRILLIAATDTNFDLQASTANVVAVLEWFQKLKRDDGSLGFDPLAFSVGGIPAESVARGPWPGTSYPPREGYHSQTESSQAYLWNWIGMEAPDLVVVMADVNGDIPQGRIYLPEDCAALASLKKVGGEKVFLWHEQDLASQLSAGRPADMGSIPALQMAVSQDRGVDSFRGLLKLLAAAKFRGPSPARAEKIRRQARSAKQLVGDLLPHYGQKLNEIAYIPVMPLVARLELAEQTGDAAYRDHVEKVAAGFVEGKRPAPLQSGSEMAGHLLFSEWARRAEGDKREALVTRARSAADLCLDRSGKPLALAPFHNEMSDAVFMSGPILAATGRLTGEVKYFDAAVRHIQSMRRLVEREDGLCRHSPLCDAPWGRGNGFVALGLALVLDDLPADHPGRKELEEFSLRHLRALVKHQDPDGAWRQVIDESGSYRELSATCMLTFAMLRGMRRGRLSRAEFGPVVARAWPAILARVGPRGELVDVCTGTGKQKTLRDYFDRPAVLGPDPRGGGMALLVAVEKLRGE